MENEFVQAHVKKARYIDLNYVNYILKGNLALQQLGPENRLAC